MDFVSGFLALCSSVGAGTATEISAAGYARQGIGFSMPRNGVCVNGNSFDFGAVEPSANIAGRGVYDAPTGGNLLLVLPHAAPRLPQGGSVDRGEAGYITLILNALASYPSGDAFSGTFSAGGLLGMCYDGDEIVGWSSTAPNAVSGVTVLPRGGQFLAVKASALSAGAALTVTRGLLAG